MSRKVKRVPYYLDSGGVRDLPATEIAAILRGADTMIAAGGRMQLSKLLKGSREKVQARIKGITRAISSPGSAEPGER